MKRYICFTAVSCLLACAADAQVRKSSRNLQPLTKRPAAEPATPKGEAKTAVPPKAAQEGPTKTTFLGPKTGWGFVKKTCPYYSPDGKRLGTLSGGTLFKYDGVKDSSRNSVLISMVKRGEIWSGPFLLDCTNIAGYEGDPDTIDPDTIANLANYFTLNGKVEDRKNELEEAAGAQNPHLATAKQTQDAYKASIEKAADMEKQMNAATGSRRSKLMDELRALKYEQAQLKTKADQAAAAHKSWKDTNAPDPAKLAADPQLKALQSQLNAAKAPVANLIPEP